MTHSDEEMKDLEETFLLLLFSDLDPVVIKRELLLSRQASLTHPECDTLIDTAEKLYTEYYNKKIQIGPHVDAQVHEFVANGYKPRPARLALMMAEYDGELAVRWLEKNGNLGMLGMFIFDHRTAPETTKCDTDTKRFLGRIVNLEYDQKNNPVGGTLKFYDTDDFIRKSRFKTKQFSKYTRPIRVEDVVTFEFKWISADPTLPSRRIPHKILILEDEKLEDWAAEPFFKIEEQNGLWPDLQSSAAKNSDLFIPIYQSQQEQEKLHMPSKHNPWTWSDEPVRFDTEDQLPANTNQPNVPQNFSVDQTEKSSWKNDWRESRNYSQQSFQVEKKPIPKQDAKVPPAKARPSSISTGVIVKMPDLFNSTKGQIELTHISSYSQRTQIYCTFDFQDLDSTQEFKEGTRVKFTIINHEAKQIEQTKMKIYMTDGFGYPYSDGNVNEVFDVESVTTKDGKCNKEADFYVQGLQLSREEDDVTEFKMLPGRFPLHPIKSLLPKYLNGFFNSKGGTLYLGVNDFGIVVGIPLTYRERDKIRIYVDNTLRSFEPSIASRKDITSVSYIDMFGANGVRLTDVFVVKIVIKQGDMTERPFWEVWEYNGYTRIKNCYVRGNASTRRLTEDERAELRRKQGEKKYRRVSDESLVKELLECAEKHYKSKSRRVKRPVFAKSDVSDTSLDMRATSEVDDEKKLLGGGNHEVSSNQEHRSRRLSGGGNQDISNQEHRSRRRLRRHREPSFCDQRLSRRSRPIVARRIHHTSHPTHEQANSDYNFAGGDIFWQDADVREIIEEIVDLGFEHWEVERACRSLLRRQNILSKREVVDILIWQQNHERRSYERRALALSPRHEYPSRPVRRHQQRRYIRQTYPRTSRISQRSYPDHTSRYYNGEDLDRPLRTREYRREVRYRRRVPKRADPVTPNSLPRRGRTYELKRDSASSFGVSEAPSVPGFEHLSPEYQNE